MVTKIISTIVITKITVTVVCIDRGRAHVAEVGSSVGSRKEGSSDETGPGVSSPS